MAENQEDRSREDLTEEASPYRIEEFRRKGMVAQSREVSGLLALAATAAMLCLLTPKMGHELAQFMTEVFRVDLMGKGDLAIGTAGRASLIKAVRLLALLALPVCLAGFAMGVAGSFGQIGSIFSTEPLTPNLEKINPLAGLKRLLSMKTAFEAARLLFKMIVVGAVAYGLVKSEVFRAPELVGSDPLSLFGAFGHSAKAILFSLLGVLVVFAGLDFWIQRWDFSKQTRMTKQEAKQEHREREGDPQLKARIRSIQREMSRRRMMAAVKKADVVVTNPTHIAIAIVYDRKKMAAPRVVAKGADFVAQRIKQIAREAGVPLVENVPLARTLFKTVKLNQTVPRALYQAVAEVLAYVYRLRKPKDFTE